MVEIKNIYGGLILKIDLANLRGADLRDANLSGAYLRGADLSYANLSGAYLRGADLSYANLCWANLRDADLRGANLRGANLRDANLSGANLRGANLRDANLGWANLRDADLRGTNLYDANLRGANLRGANLQSAKSISTTVYSTNRACPPSGDFIAWKKCLGGAIVKLKIPWFSRRCNAIGSRKCRAEMAIVLDIEKDGKRINECVSLADENCVYRVGEHVCCDKYDPDWRIECSGGIHFFVSRQEAVEFEL